MPSSASVTTIDRPKGTGIARQFLLLYVLGSLLPLGLLSALVLQGASDQIRSQSDERLRQASKTAGMALLGRLGEVHRMLEQVSASSSRNGGSSLGGFEQAFSTVVDGAGRQVIGTDPPWSGGHGPEGLGADGERLVTLGSNLAFFVDGKDGGSRWIGVVRSEHVMEPIFNALPPGGEACLLVRQGVSLGCSFGGALPAPLAGSDLFEATSGPIAWTAGDERFQGQFWSVFLRANFGADPFVIVMAEPASRLAEPLAAFQLLSASTIALAFLLVLFVSLTQIRHRLSPLRALVQGTRQVAAGDFDAQVEVSTGNELEELGDAFNRMTGDLRASFEAQSRLIEFDRRLLSASDERALVELLHDTLGTMLAAASAQISLVWGGVDAESLRMTFCGVGSQAREQGKRDPELEDWSQALDEAVVPSASLPAVLRPLLPEHVELSLVFPLPVEGSASGLVLVPIAEVPEASAVAQARGIVDRCAIALAHQRSIEANQQLRDYDQLTGLPNRSLFKNRLTGLLAQDSERRTEWVVAIAGIDGFKALNESLGHQHADRLLQVIAFRLRKVFGEGHVARLGGDEFGLVVEGEADLRDVERRVAAGIEEATHPVAIEHWTIRPTLTAGASCFPADGETPDALLVASDSALHHAKREGPGSLKFFVAEMSDRAVRRLELLSALEGAAGRGELRVYYQPVLEVDSLDLASVEALVRWQRPEQGLVMPGAFIELAEERGLDVGIGAWVLEQACRDIAGWEADGLEAPRVAVNLTARQLEDPQLRSSVLRALAATGIQSNRIGFELTERSLASETVAANLEALRRLGARLSVDDFGTGYSSLAYLQRFPLDVLKIDQSFISQVCEEPQAATITRACVAMAHELGLLVVAEGVETEGQLAFLRECRCDYAQGFLFSHAIPEDGLRKWITAGGRPGI